MSNYSKPQVTIELDEYNELLKAKEESLHAMLIKMLLSCKGTTQLEIISEMNHLLAKQDFTLGQGDRNLITVSIRVDCPTAPAINHSPFKPRFQ